MNERAALDVLSTIVPHAGDDAAVVDGHVLTTDMLHETTDFPDGTTRYTAGWRAVGASLSDVAAMGAEAVAAVAVYAAPALVEREVTAFVEGATDVCEAVGAAYVGGDLDQHDEFTVVSTVLGRTDAPVFRSGAQPGEVVCVTGTLGRTPAAIRLFECDEHERANALFRFDPRVATGLALGPYASAMMDSSDGLARSLHQLAAASGCGFAIEEERLPVDETVDELATDPDERREWATAFGEDFELVFTVPRDALPAVRSAVQPSVSVLGEVTDAADGVRMDGESLSDRGYTHGGR